MIGVYSRLWGSRRDCRRNAAACPPLLQSLRVANDRHGGAMSASARQVSIRRAHAGDAVPMAALARELALHVCDPDPETTRRPWLRPAFPATPGASASWRRFRTRSWAMRAIRADMIRTCESGRFGSPIWPLRIAIADSGWAERSLKPSRRVRPSLRRQRSASKSGKRTLPRFVFKIEWAPSIWAIGSSCGSPSDLGRNRKHNRRPSNRDD